MFPTRPRRAFAPGQAKDTQAFLKPARTRACRSVKIGVEARAIFPLLMVSTGTSPRQSLTLVGVVESFYGDVQRARAGPRNSPRTRRCARCRVASLASLAAAQ